MDRRNFIKLTTGTTLLSRAASTAQVSANDRIQIATIGIGSQGMDDTNTALKMPGVELVAAADVYDGRLTRAKEIYGRHVFTTREYREVLARPDVDAILIATPDHWHAQITIEALNAGKDVYIQKPMVQVIEDGHKVIETQRKSNRILQVGSQRVSSIIYHKAKELIAAGTIGELNLVEAWWNRNSAIGAWQYSIPPGVSPANIDWDRFLGKAPKVPFQPIRLFRWRNYQDYGTGVAGDLFVHLFSGLHAVVGSIGPTRVMSSGGLRFWNDGRDVPDVMLGLYDYPKTANHPAFNLALKVNFADGGGENSGFRFVGSEGSLILGGNVTVSRKPRAKEPGFTTSTFPKSVQDEFMREYRKQYPETQPQMSGSTEETYLPPHSYSDQYDHLKNFFDALRSRQPVVEDAVFGLRAAGPALLSNKSYFAGRAYGWNPETMRVIK